MFVVCGEALMDVFASAETDSGMALDARVGGSPFNTAVGLARLGQPVNFFGAISSGFLGERLMRTLQHEGVGTATVQRNDAATTLGLVGLDAAGVPSYSFYGDGCADRLLTPDAIDTLPQTVGAIHVGSYATVVEPVASTLRQLVDQYAARTLISFDPNIRLNVEPELARWRDLLDWMLPRAHLLKISDEDLQLLLPGTSLDDFAADVLQQGVRLLVVTRGAEGVSAWTRRTRASVAAQPVDVVDTVGAGDTFQAALLTWLSENGRLTPDGLSDLSQADLEAASRFAGQAAAITCSRRGADMPRRAELVQGWRPCPSTS
ncbi:carbohydrate kinase family protein [Piscinibacter sakaiensis]|uniref:carbohydrate kinase family protein n=1 Tax=Piscinibacter sakaiensis TaxID=1547922 RepID=UPI003AAFFEDF